MPELNWDIFEKLPGAQTTNWELLCRELVRRNYAQYGSFRSLAQQAGIEFHLDVTTNCSLGDPSCHWGWQCRWYGLPAGRQILATRRNKIEKAIRTTEQYLPDLTDWVLWTRRSLTPTDQDWFYEIATQYKLHLWTEREVVGLLTGEAEILRATYFGELVLTSEKLGRMHAEAMAPIIRRWDPLLHVEVDVERDLKAAFGTPGTWPVVKDTSDRLANRAAMLRSETARLREGEQELAKRVSNALQNQSTHLNSVAAALDEASIATVRQSLRNSVEPEFTKRDLSRLAAQLRSVKHPAGLSIASASWEIGNYFSLLSQLTEKLEQNLFAVVGDAGFGKTYLAAELTKVSDDSPGGVLLLAKYLGSKGTLDDLARRVPFGGERMEQLLEAVDAAGARLDRRIPIVIDGLNESENPQDWKDLLATMKVQLSRNSNCVIIVTLRSAVAEDALPPDTTTLRLSGFEHDPEKAIRTYFDYYKIDPTDAQLPWAQLSSPLFLSLFCQVTNPQRAITVGEERIPRSLTAVFEKYRELVVSRAAVALNIAQHDIESALQRVGLALWDENARSLDFDTLRELVGDQPRAWADSLARFLEEEGILTREPALHFAGFGWDGRRGGNQVSAILYDPFAGFLIADAILTQQRSAGIRDWISENWKTLDISGSDRHPFADDILTGLVGLLPRRYHCQMWKSAPSPLREAALLETTTLDAESIDDDTSRELMQLCRQHPAIGRRDPFSRLWCTRGSVQHPLNADFLDKVLIGMEVGHRDLQWTEWLRRNQENIVDDLVSLEQRWCQDKERNSTDQLCARWVSWTLTSTVRCLRDQATKTLYWYGIGAPQTFFESAIGSLDVNDPYVPERMFAAAYGVLMGRQLTVEEVRKPLEWLFSQMKERLSGENATTPTNHWMTRAYVQGIVDFARRFAADTVPNDVLDSDGRFRFAPAAYLAADSVKNHHTAYLGHDFENYRVGRLFNDREKYDYKHEAFKAAMTEIRGRVWELGWRECEFKEIDSQIGSHYAHRNEAGKAERYAKKYGWIGFYEKAGVLTDAKQLSWERRAESGNPIVDIDPSFPQEPPNVLVVVPSWVEHPSNDNKDWLVSGEVAVPDELLRTHTFGSHEGPWIAVSGFLKTTNKILGRRTVGFIRGILAAKDEAGDVVSLLNLQQYIDSSYVREEPSDYYTFAGEIPWSDEFAVDKDYDEDLGLYEWHIGGHWTDTLVVEGLSHCYAWEDYHSSVNRAGGCSVPSKWFSREFDLRSAPSSFSQFEPNGKLAAISVSPPESFDRSGSILYLREDLLCQYADARNLELVWVVWGERNLTNLGYNHPDWLHEIYQLRGNSWRRIVAFGDLTKHP